MRRRFGVLTLGLLLLACVLGPAAAPPVLASEHPLCFNLSGLPNCISGAFRNFWEAAGGLAQFGYPLTGELQEQTPDGIYWVQYFERARFEHHPDAPPAYRVQLGRLGAEQLGQAPLVREAPRSGCRYFETTGLNVCEPFLSSWLRPGVRAGQGSLELFGLPLTPPTQESDAGGRPIQVQWFERARVERHSDGSIVFGLLGAELLQRRLAPDPNQLEPTPVPTAVSTPVPTADTPPVPTTGTEPTPIATALPQPTPTALSEPTPTPLPAPSPPPPPATGSGGAPTPPLPCNRNVPAPVLGLQAWPADPVVTPPENAVICVRLILEEGPVRGAIVRTIRHTPSGPVASITHFTGGEGVADFIFYVGDLPSGSIPVQAIATYGGRTFEAWTSVVRD